MNPNVNVAMVKKWGPLLAALAAVGMGCSGSRESADPVLDRYRQFGRRIDSAAESIERAVSAPRRPLSVAHLAAKMNLPTPPPASEGAEPAIAFRVQGIIRNERAPLVLTSHGVAGLGEEVDGFKVTDIQNDAVTFSDRHGRSIRLPLYKEAPTP